MSKRLGHSSPAITAKIYSHMLDGRDKEAARLWEALQTREAEAGSLAASGKELEAMKVGVQARAVRCCIDARNCLILLKRTIRLLRNRAGTVGEIGGKPLILGESGIRRLPPFTPRTDVVLYWCCIGHGDERYSPRSPFGADLAHTNIKLAQS